MFSYIGFSWDPTRQIQIDVARQLAQALCARGGWRLDLDLCGHRVYTRGTARGINDSYPLPAKRGVIVGRLFRRGDPPRQAPEDVTLSDGEAQQIAQTEGQALVEHFWGRYVAFMPSSIGAPRILRDPTGALPCYRVDIEGVSIVLSWLEDLISLSGVMTPSVNWEAVAAHLLFGQLSGRDTALKGVTQVLPGELTAMSSRGGPPRSLWSAVDMARHPEMRAPTDAEAQLRETTVHCVRSWGACYGSIVVRLSGGVDSAILLGSLCAGGAAQRLTCLNYFSAGSDSDERLYARLAAQRAGTVLVERHRDTMFNLEEVLHVAQTPTPSNYLGTLGAHGTDLEVAAAHQAKAVFTGAGGDQLFFEFRCAWPAADYLRLRGLDTGFLEATLDSAHLGRVSFWKALKRAFLDQSFKGNLAEGAGRHLRLIQHEAKQAAARAAWRFVHPDWLRAADLPIGKFHQVCALAGAFDYYDPYHPASIERLHPLLSQPLLELCLATPTFTLTRGGLGRALARRAFASELPPEIAMRRSKGGIEEHVTEVLRRNLPFARDMLLDGHLARQGLLDRKAVEAALSGHPGNTAYVSEIHSCIAVEAWARRIAGGTP